MAAFTLGHFVRRMSLSVALDGFADIYEKHLPTLQPEARLCLPRVILGICLLDLFRLEPAVGVRLARQLERGSHRWQSVRPVHRHHRPALPVVLLAMFSHVVSLLCCVPAGWLYVPVCTHSMGSGSADAPSCCVGYWTPWLVWRRRGFIGPRCVMKRPAKQITGTNAGGPRRLPMWTRRVARVSQLCRLAARESCCL